MEIASYPVPVFIGLRFKPRCSRHRDWCNYSQTEHVTEIYSVSNCVTGGPIIWYDGSALGVHWTAAENIAPWFQLDANSQAELIELEVLRPGEYYREDELRLCAYRIIPLAFTNAVSPAVLEASQLFVTEYALPLPDWTNFERLGYDVVQFKPIRLLDLDGAHRAERHLTSPSYGCSPLSCNGLAIYYPRQPLLPLGRR